MNKNFKIAIGIGVVGLLGAGAYFLIKKKGKSELDKVAEGIGNIDKGTDTNFNPKESAENLYKAMKGWGTNKPLIWNTLDPLDAQKRLEVKNYFDANYGKGEDLIEWFEDDLSGADLKKALAYYGKNNK
jgi:hypothetical protein